MEAYESELRDFVYSGEKVIHTRCDMDFIPRKQMCALYNDFTASRRSLPLSTTRFTALFPYRRVKPALSPYGLDGYLGFALAQSDRFEKAKEGVGVWLEKPVKAEEKEWFRADYNSLIRLYNRFAKQHGFPTFKEYAGPFFPSSNVISAGPVYELEYWNFEKALNKLGFSIPIPALDGEEVEIVDRAGVTRAKVILA